MKIAALFAFAVPEVKRMNWGQLLAVWTGCTGWSRDKVYLHLILLLACCSVIFNLTLRLGGGLLLDLLGLLVGLLVPANIYFAGVLGSRRTEIRKFIEDHWAEFNR